MFKVLLPLLCNLEFGGFQRTYLLHLPKSYVASKTYPLVFVFHGAGGTGELAAEITGWHHKADVEGFIAVFPDGLAKDPSRPQSFMRNPQFWNAGVASSGVNRPDDVAFVQALLEVIQSEHKIDDRRIYATGFSNGAAMAWRLAVDLSDVIAAIGPIAGFLAIPDPKPVRAVPALVIACEDDPMIPIDGGMVKDIWSKEARNRPSLRAIVKNYAQACGCSDEPVVLTAGSGVTHFFYQPYVHFYTIAEAGHTYPGGAETLSERLFGKRTDKLNATDLLWDFFKVQHL
jgi:polyhydroxybutyrate depolymerase